MMIFEIVFDRSKEFGAKIAVLSEEVAIFKINNSNIWSNGSVFSFFGKSDEGIFGLGQIIILDKRSGGAFDAANIQSFCDKAGEAQSGIFRSVFLKISGFVALVNNNKAEIVNWREKGRTRADNNLWGGGI